MISDESRYRILKELEANPEISQRELARSLGISLGKVNYCLKALIDKGMVKAGNFSRSDQKSRYLYQLTPQGVEHKAKVTARFLKLKLDEYDALQQEIEELRREVGQR